MQSEPACPPRLQNRNRYPHYFFLLYFSAGVLLAFSIYMQLANGRAGDKDWQLYGTQMWLLGKTLHDTTYFDINSPLLNYIYAPPEYISLHTGISDNFLLPAFGLCAVSFIVWLCTKIISVHPAFSCLQKKGEFALVLCFIMIFFTNPAYFFHREHIFLIFTLPYILRFMPSVEAKPLSLRIRFLVGCIAGIGFCMKPHCLVVWLVVQLLCAWRHRSWRIVYYVENICVFGAHILYILSICWLASNYLTVVLPMALETYGVYNYKKNSLFYLAVGAIMLGVAMADFRARYTSPYRKDIYYLLGICAGCAAYGLINNGWGYTYGPLYSFIYLTMGFLLWEYNFLLREYRARGLPIRPFTLGMRACIIDFAVNVVLVLALYYQTLTYHCEGRACNTTDAFLSEVQSPDGLRSFGTLSMEFMPWVELARAGAPWETRFHHFWMLPKFFVAGPEFARSHRWITDYVSAKLAQDINTNKPSVVFVDDSDDFIAVKTQVDLVAYFNTHDDFRQAWKPYRYVHTIDNCPLGPDGREIKIRCSYRVYRRDAL